jgi:hypothetical protein
MVVVLNMKLHFDDETIRAFDVFLSTERAVQASKRRISESNLPDSIRPTNGHLIDGCSDLRKQYCFWSHFLFPRKTTL